MRIGELAKALNIPTSTIRFYESKGLVPFAERGSNGYRNYGKDALQRLNVIRFSQNMGLALDDIKKFFDSAGGWDMDLINNILSQHLDEIEILQNQLKKKKKKIKFVKDKLNEQWISGIPFKASELEELIEYKD